LHCSCDIKFEIRKKIGVYIALLMDIPSLDELQSLIAAFVNSINSDESSNQMKLPAGTVKPEGRRGHSGARNSLIKSLEPCWLASVAMF
jgi:hypothetical protein